MSKIYETPDDLKREALVYKSNQAKRDANDSLVKVGVFSAIGGLLHLVDQAKASIPAEQASKVWKFLGEQGSAIPGKLKFATFFIAGVGLIEALRYGHHFKKAEKELSELGATEKIIVRNTDGDQLEFLKGKKETIKIPHQANTVIHASSVQAERMEEITSGKAM